MYRLTCSIEIRCSEGVLRLSHASEIEIKKDAGVLCDTLRLTLPKIIRWRGAERNPIRRGDEIRVWLGYNDRNRLAFVGLVRKIEPHTPMVIEAQDMMCRYQTVDAKKKAYTSTTLNTLLKDQGVDCVIKGTQSVGAYRVECNTVSELLSSLHRQGIRSMMRIGGSDEPTMYSGLIISPPDVRTFLADERTIADKSKLQYAHADSVRFLVRVKNNSTTKAKRRDMKRVEVGYKDGELRTFNVINMTEAEMREYAEVQYAKLQQGGLSGEVTLFGGEIVDKLDGVRVIIEGHDEGVYQVERNNITWGSGGFRQCLTINTKLSQ